MCGCAFASKRRPQNDLYFVERDVKPYSLTTETFVWLLSEIDGLLLYNVRACIYSFFTLAKHVMHSIYAIFLATVI